MMRDALYGGVNAAILTPMKRDLSPDLDRLEKHARWLLSNGCNGLGLLGTTGEANSFGFQERIDIMEGLVARGISAKKLMPGTGTSALMDTVLLTRKAAELGCPGALLLPPFYYKNPSEDGLFAYFSEVAQRVGGSIKLYLYHFPAQSAVPLSVDLFARLLKAYPGTFKGVKDSSGDWNNTRGYVETFARDGFEVYCGDDAALTTNLKAGGAGCITAASNVNCTAGAIVYANPDSPAAERAQAVLAATRKAVTTVPLIPSLKTLIARNTGDAGWKTIRPPHLPLTAEQESKLFAALDASGVALARAA